MFHHNSGSFLRIRFSGYLIALLKSVQIVCRFQTPFVVIAFVVSDVTKDTGPYKSVITKWLKSQNENPVITC